MQQFNFPTKIFFGDGSLQQLADAILKMGLKKPLLVTDNNLVKFGLVDKVKKPLTDAGLVVSVFADTHTNPIEEDVEKGLTEYKNNNCDCFVALGGGSPMDVAKVIMLRAHHPLPLEQYDDALGGDRLIVNDMPPLFAIPTTAGTGSEVGRSGVITLKPNNTKTIFFHPDMLPKIAVLSAELTQGLPKGLTVATGLDAFTHCLEAFLAPGFHPMADGIALEGMRLVLSALPKVYKNGSDLTARGEMLVAATMGATAFQKGLGMIHSMAHPLSTECGLHHGLANALCLPYCIEFIENHELSESQRAHIQRVIYLFHSFGFKENTLAKNCRVFFEGLGIKFGLQHHGVNADQLQVLSKKAFADACHSGNMISVSEEDFLNIFKEVFE